MSNFLPLLFVVFGLSSPFRLCGESVTPHTVASEGHRSSKVSLTFDVSISAEVENALADLRPMGQRGTLFILLKNEDPNSAFNSWARVQEKIEW